MIEATRDYATAVFRLETPDKDGVSQRSKMEQVEKSSGKRPAALDHDPMPEAANDAWAAWLDLHAGRTQNGMGISPVSWLDLDAWSRMRGHKPTYTELELIRTIDRAFCEVQAKGSD